MEMAGRLPLIQKEKNLQQRIFWQIYASCIHLGQTWRIIVGLLAEAQAGMPPNTVA
jgi:hypothetical protein